LSDDYGHMSCERWREAISATIDGEDPGLDVRLVDAHVARCPSCRTFRAASDEARRATRLHAAQPMPDLSRSVTRLTAIADRAARWSTVRVLLAVVAVEIVAFSVPMLILGDDAGSSTHTSRHLGAFTAAYGVGLLVVVVRPARARTMLPVAAVLAGALVITSIIDLVEGRIPLTGEAQHLPELISVVLIWLLTVPTPRRSGRAGTRNGFEDVELRVVDHHRDAG
jgi:predicted anti-sigma-YlaC factor YlaD